MPTQSPSPTTLTTRINKYIAAVNEARTSHPNSYLSDLGITVDEAIALLKEAKLLIVSNVSNASNTSDIPTYAKTSESVMPETMEEKVAQIWKDVKEIKK